MQSLATRLAAYFVAEDFILGVAGSRSRSGTANSSVVHRGRQQPRAPRMQSLATRLAAYFVAEDCILGVAGSKGPLGTRAFGGSRNGVSNHEHQGCNPWPRCQQPQRVPI